jgi:predicted nucleic acid-binding Zn ribbon protein
MSTWRPSGPRPSEQEPRRISESLDQVTRRLGGPSTDVLAKIFGHWAELVGPDIAAHARPLSLRRGELVLVVDHPAWAGQLRFMTGDLLAKIGEATGSAEVRQIRIRVSV